MIKISDELYADLLAYHLGQDPDPELPERIRDALVKKQETRIRRAAYSQALASDSPDERRRALEVAEALRPR